MVPLLPLFSFEARRGYLRNLYVEAGREAFRTRLTGIADRMGQHRFRRQAADDLLAETRPAEVLPEVYGAYRPIVADGIRFLLSRLSLSRLIDLAADQAALPEAEPMEGRLLVLVQRLPSLHKLGQIIARNRHLDPELKRRLTALENGPAATDMAVAASIIQSELGGEMGRFSIRLGEAPIAEASVGVVVPFTYIPAGRRVPRAGVFKILKPGVRERLVEELDLLNDLARLLDERRGDYALADFRFIEVFADIRLALLEEVDLAGEQENLTRAHGIYDGRGNVRIPEVLPFSTPNVTAMAFLPGAKVTDPELGGEDRRRTARDLFRTVVWSPLFSSARKAPFHGDPHAGNLLADPGGRLRPRTLGLVDWSLSGTLSKKQRSRLVMLMLGVVTGEEKMVVEVVKALSTDGNRERPRFEARLLRTVREIMGRDAYGKAGFLVRVFLLIDGLAVGGFGFPTHLLLFRKAFFTLDGVIRDLDPGFDPDAAMVEEMARLFLAEAPQRWMALVFPHLDRAANYRSLLSNRDLRWITGYLLLELIKNGTDVAAAVLGRACRKAPPFCLLPRLIPGMGR